MIKSQNNKCWICGSKDLSREHRYKRADLEREYFNSANGKTALVSLESGKARELQGANSTLVKFRPSLCKKCNNSFSQPFDYAYDNFIVFLKKNENEIYKSPNINLVSIFRSKLQEKRENLIKYFIKHLGCTLTEYNIEVPLVLLNYLNNISEINNVMIYISQSIDRKRYLDSLNASNIPGSWVGCSDIQYEYNEKNNVINYVHYELYYRSFSFYIKIDEAIQGFDTNIKHDIIEIRQYHEELFQKN